MNPPVFRRRKRLERKPASPKTAVSGAAPAASAIPAEPSAAREAGPNADDDANMSLREHLSELRTRLLRCVVSVFVCFAGLFSFAPAVRGIMGAALRKALPASGTITFIDVTEPFMVDMHLAFVLGFCVASPYIFYQIWAFIAPGLYESERKHVVPLAFCSVLLFLAGSAFCFFVVIPFTYTFFIGYGSDEATPMITLANMYHYTFRLMLAFGLVFEMPLVSFFLATVRIVTAARLKAWRKYAILANFIIAALITPPDVLSQLLLAGPLILLYEVSILVAGFAAPDGAPPPPNDSGTPASA